MTKTIDAEISALKAFHRVDTDAELAEALGVAANTISTWRRRGVLPERHRASAAVHNSLQEHEFFEKTDEVSESVRSILKLNAIERQALKVALVRFASEHSEFGSTVASSIRATSGITATFAGFMQSAYQDILRLCHDEDIGYEDAGTILILRYLGHLEAAKG